MLGMQLWSLQALEQDVAFNSAAWLQRRSLLGLPQTQGALPLLDSS